MFPRSGLEDVEPVLISCSAAQSGVQLVNMSFFMRQTCQTILGGGKPPRHRDKLNSVYVRECCKRYASQRRQKARFVSILIQTWKTHPPPPHFFQAAMNNWVASEYYGGALRFLDWGPSTWAVWWYKGKTRPAEAGGAWVKKHVCPLGPGPGKVVIWKTNFTLMTSTIWMSKMFSEVRPPVSSVIFLTCY